MSAGRLEHDRYAVPMVASGPQRSLPGPPIAAE